MRLWLLAALLCGFLSPLSAQNTPPTFPAEFTGHAQFETTAGFKQAGWATIITTKPGAEAYIVTVRRLFGTKGGFSHQIPAAEMRDFVRSIHIDSFSGEGTNYFATALPLASSEVDTSARPLNDLTLFKVHNGSPVNKAVVISSQVPAVGDTVWVAVKTKTDGLSMAAAKVVSAPTSGWSTIQLDARETEKEPSGAPILNSAGELVGIYSHKDGNNPATGDFIPGPMILQSLTPAIQ